jgi:DnaJ-class molecular chaperone
MDERDLYGDLGVARSVGDDELRAAYLKLARKYHPDVNPGDHVAEDRFKEISFAYEVLSDKEKRARYDGFGMAGLAEGFDPEQARAWANWNEGARRSPGFESFASDVDLEDLLSGFFGGERARVPVHGHDVEAPLEVDFLDALRGAEVRIQLPGQGPLRVRIPAGARDGARVRVAGKGGPSPRGGPAGDLYLRLRVRPHPFFERDGDDLRVDLPVTLPEAILGAQVEVPTAHGSAKMTIPPRSRNGQTLRLRGKGAPRRSGGHGDLYVRIVVELPEGDDERLEALAQEMAPLYEGRDVRSKLRNGR